MSLQKNVRLSLLLALLFCCAVTNTHAVQTLQISIPEFNRPSTSMAQKILLKAYAQLGITIHFVAVPAVRGLAMWNTGQVDGITVRFLDYGPPDSIKVSVPVAYDEAVVFTLNKQFSVDGYASLQPYVVGYIAGVSVFLDRLKDIPKKEAAPNLESLFRKLQAGRTEVAIDSRHSLCLARQLGFKDIVILEPSLEKAPGYHYLHQRYANLVAPLEAILRAMEKDGSIKQIQREVMQEFMAHCR